MTNLDDSIAQVWQTVGRLEEQIEMTIHKLCNDNILEPVEFFPIAGSAPKTENKNNVTQRRNKPGPKCSKQGFLASRKKNDENAMEIDPPINDEHSLNKSLNTTLPPKKSITSSKNVFTVVEEESFLTFVLNKWVFGATFINSSKTSQKLPEMVLKLMDEDENNIESQCLSYGYKKGVVQLGREDFLGNSNVENPLTIPVQEVMLGNCGEVRPGCKFYVSASFDPPLMTDYDRPASLLVALISEENLVWKKYLALDPHASARHENNGIFKKFQERILVELSEHSEQFSVRNLQFPTFSLEEFLEKELRLSKIQTVKTGFDTQTDYFATEDLNSLWGLLVQVERCERASENFHGIVFSRSSHQLDYFLKSLSKWVAQQKDANPGVSLETNQGSNSKDPSIVAKAMQDEIRTLIHFIYMQEQASFQKKDRTSSSKPDISSNPSALSKWLQTYIQEMSSTDAKFM